MFFKLLVGANPTRLFVAGIHGDEEAITRPIFEMMIKDINIISGREIEVEGEIFREVLPKVKTEEISSEITVEYCIIVNVHGQDNEQAYKKEGDHESHESVAYELGGTSFC